MRKRITLGWLDPVEKAILGALLVALVAFVSVLTQDASAEVDGDVAFAVTDTSASVDFTTDGLAQGPAQSVLFYVISGSDTYIRLYHCGDTISAVTTANAKIILSAGEHFSVTFDHREVGDATQASQGYCGFAAINEASGSATMWYVAK